MKGAARIGRRAFLAASGATSLALIGCATRPPPRTTPSAPARLDPVLARLLGAAALAPSRHNEQPWAVRILDARRVTIAPDPARRLPAVDPDARDALLALGAFVENLDVAARAEGLDARIDVEGATAGAASVGVALAPAPRAEGGMQRIASRTTVRSELRRERLAPEDLAVIGASESGPIVYVAPETRPGRAIAEIMVAATRAQILRDAAQRELASFIRFRDEDAERLRDGYTLESLGIHGIARMYVERFYDASSALDPSFRARSIDGVAALARAQGGFLVVTSDDASPRALVEAGRVFERAFLRARERNVGFHPIAAAVEEPAFAEALQRELRPPRPIQLLVRVGYADDYPEPSTWRRPVAWFTAS